MSTTTKISKIGFGALLIGYALLMALTSGCGDDATGTACLYYEDCEPGQACAFFGAGNTYDEYASGVCVDAFCRRDSDCDDGVCVDEVCYAPGGDCLRDRDCPEGQFCDEAGQCAAQQGGDDVVEDTSDSDADDATSDLCEPGCADGFVCQGGECVEDSSGVCDPECGAGFVCQDGECVEDGPAVCEPACALGYTCQDGECVEDDPSVCNPACGTGEVCQNGQCIPNRCELVASDCSDPDRPYLTYSEDGSCACSGCATDSDCNTAVGEICLEQGGRGRCIYTTGQTCSSRSDCANDGYCQAGQCTECLSEHDCPGSGDVCMRGRCGQCECPAGLVCDILGNCVEQLDGSSCSTAADCVGPAQQLGWSGDTSLLGCDQSVGGCYVMGQCNGILGGDDPWGGQCKPSSSCEAPLSEDDFIELLINLFLGIGDGIISKCACDPSRPDMCRTGEDCRAGGFLGMGSNYSCQKPGGGFPFPF